MFKRYKRGLCGPPSPPQLPLYPGDKLSGFLGLFPEIFDTFKQMQFALSPAVHTRLHEPGALFGTLFRTDNILEVVLSRLILLTGASKLAQWSRIHLP